MKFSSKDWGGFYFGDEVTHIYTGVKGAITGVEFGLGYLENTTKFLVSIAVPRTPKFAEFEGQRHLISLYWPLVRVLNPHKHRTLIEFECKYDIGDYLVDMWGTARGYCCRITYDCSDVVVYHIRNENDKRVSLLNEYRCERRDSILNFFTTEHHRPTGVGFNGA